MTWAGFKAHGLGNDYVVLERGPALDPPAAVALCDRHHGIGSDGILEPAPTSRADYGVTIWNPDGSIAEKSGNGLRIFAWWLHRFRGAPTAFTVDTGHQVVHCSVDGVVVTVQMGRAGVTDLAPVRLSDTSLDVTAVDLGNPHAVIWTDEPDLDALPWRTWGARLEVDRARFPDRTNVQLARSVGPGRLEARIWERGAGETLASGSSACAVAAVAVHRGTQATGVPLTVGMPGGTLEVRIDADGAVVLTGPVAPIGRFELDPTWRPA